MWNARVSDYNSIDFRLREQWLVLDLQMIYKTWLPSRSETEIGYERNYGVWLAHTHTHTHTHRERERVQLVMCLLLQTIPCSAMVNCTSAINTQATK